MKDNILLKKLSHRSNYRGCKETDLLLGKFAKEYLHQLTDEQLIEYDFLLNQPDLDIYHAFINPSLAPIELKNLSIWQFILKIF